MSVNVQTFSVKREFRLKRNVVELCQQTCNILSVLLEILVISNLPGLCRAVFDGLSCMGDCQRELCISHFMCVCVCVLMLIVTDISTFNYLNEQQNL